jgi:hypothetical protein
MTALSGHVSSPRYRAELQKSLDEKRNNAFAAAGVSTGMSVVVSLLPGDAGTAISQKLADIAGFFMLVTGVILLEKILLALSGLLVFTYVIPLSLVLLLTCIWLDGTGEKGRVRKQIAFVLFFKCFTFGILLFFAIPASIMVSNMVETTFLAKEQEEIQQIPTLGSRITAEIAADVEQIQIDLENNAAEAPERGFFDISGKAADAFGKFKDSALKLFDRAKGIAKSALEKTQKMVESLLNSLVVMVITTCIIPLLTTLGFWILVKALWRIDVAAVSGIASQKQRNPFFDLAVENS